MPRPSVEPQNRNGVPPSQSLHTGRLGWRAGRDPRTSSLSISACTGEEGALCSARQVKLSWGWSRSQGSWLPPQGHCLLRREGVAGPLQNCSCSEQECQPRCLPGWLGLAAEPSLRSHAPLNGLEAACPLGKQMELLGLASWAGDCYRHRSSRGKHAGRKLGQQLCREGRRSFRRVDCGWQDGF